MSQFETVKEYEDITFKRMGNIARIAFNRPEVEMRSDQKPLLNCTMPFIRSLKTQQLVLFY